MGFGLAAAVVGFAIGRVVGELVSGPGPSADPAITLDE
jgi:hypothetical protein